MRTGFYECKRHSSYWRKKAIDAMPWASKVLAVVDGYRGWESWDDYHIWENQKSINTREIHLPKTKKQSFFVVNYSSYEDELYCNAEIFTNNDDAVRRFKELVSQIQQEGYERDFYYVPQCEPDAVVYRAYNDSNVELMVRIDKVEINN